MPLREKESKPSFGLVNYSKAPELPRSLKPSHIDIDDSRSRGTDSAKSHQFFDLGFFSLGYCFDAAVSEVSNPSYNA